MCLAPPHSPTQGTVSHPIGTELLMDLPHEIWATKRAGVTSDPYTYEQTARAALLAPLLPMSSSCADMARSRPGRHWDGGKGILLGLGGTDPYPAAATRCGSWSGRRCSAGLCCHFHLPGSPRGSGEPVRPRQRPGGGWQPCQGWMTFGWTDGTTPEGPGCCWRAVGRGRLSSP